VKIEGHNRLAGKLVIAGHAAADVLREPDHGVIVDDLSAIPQRSATFL
jgi:hypothetical protein